MNSLDVKKTTGSHEKDNNRPSIKKRKIETISSSKDEKKADCNVEINSVVVEHSRPKSRKEARAEKKASKKAASSSAEKKVLSENEYRLQKKDIKRKLRREQKMQMIREERRAKKLKKQKRLRRESNAPGGGSVAELKRLRSKQNKIENIHSGFKKQKESAQEQESDMNVYDKVFNGDSDDCTSMTALRMGVKYLDVVVGKEGPTAEENTLVTVAYKLTGGKFGAVIDSSKKFSFRLGKGEVIQGWEIGVMGMRAGGKRKLVVPPKAGYGSQDIGAGSGATLYFDISLLSMR